MCLVANVPNDPLWSQKQRTEWMRSVAMCQATQLSQKQGELSKRNLQNYADALQERSSDSFQCTDSSGVTRKSPNIFSKN